MDVLLQVVALVIMACCIGRLLDWLQARIPEGRDVFRAIADEARRISEEEKP